MYFLYIGATRAVEWRWVENAAVLYVKARQETFTQPPLLPRNCFIRNIRGTPERRGGRHIGFPEHLQYHTDLTRPDLNGTSTQPNEIPQGCGRFADLWTHPTVLGVRGSRQQSSERPRDQEEHNDASSPYVGNGQSGDLK